MPYPGIDGFLGTRASIMLDIVFLAMFAVVPVLAWSVWLVKYRKRYALHKLVQVGLGVVLLAAVTLFEIDMRFISGWRDRALASPFYAPQREPASLLIMLFERGLGLAYVPGWVFIALTIHLFFAVTTTLLWIVVIVRALRNFPSPPSPGAHSKSHAFWGWLAALDMGMTAVTGWIFYWLAFVA
jgi:putative membrane protein